MTEIFATAEDEHMTEVFRRVLPTHMVKFYPSPLKGGLIFPGFAFVEDDDIIKAVLYVPEVEGPATQFEVRDVGVGSQSYLIYSAPPYYFCLHTPGSLVEDGRMDVKYDPETATVLCRVAKGERGRYIQVRRYLTLISPLEKVSAWRKKEVRAPWRPSRDLGDTPRERLIALILRESEDKFDSEMRKISDPMYQAQERVHGLDRLPRTAGGNFARGKGMINELKSSGITNYRQTQQVEDCVLQHFNPDKYLADTLRTPQVVDCRREWMPRSTRNAEAWALSTLKQTPLPKDLLCRPKQLYLGLLQLLFGWAYERCVYPRGRTSNSAWTVGKLAPMMATLHFDFERASDVLVACTRRALVFPSVRSWRLVQVAWRLVLETLRCGLPAVRDALSELRTLFDSESVRVYRDIWIDVYYRWVEHTTQAAIWSMATECERALNLFTKKDVGLDLDLLEGPAKDVAKKAVSDPHW